jgi:hypothetical protein
MTTEDIVSVIMIVIIGAAVYTVAHVWLHIV